MFQLVVERPERHERFGLIKIWAPFIFMWPLLVFECTLPREAWRGRSLEQKVELARQDNHAVVGLVAMVFFWGTPAVTLLQAILHRAGLADAPVCWWLFLMLPALVVYVVAFLLLLMGNEEHRLY